MRKVSTHEAKTHLSALLREVAKGGEIRILRGEIPVAKLVPLDDASKPRRPKTGTITSAPIQCTKDAFAPLDEHDLKEWGLV